MSVQMYNAHTTIDEGKLIIIFDCPGCPNTFDVEIDELGNSLFEEETDYCCDECGIVVPSLFYWFQLDLSKRLDLIEWYNVAELSLTDIKRLVKLERDGQFFSGDCGHCGETILAGSPYSWGNFQGVLQSEHLGELCGDCAMLYYNLKKLAGE